MASRTVLRRRVLWVCVCAAGPLLAADVAPVSSYEGKPIAAVRFEPAVQPIASDDLNRLLLWKAGDPLHLADVRATIKRLYGTGAYSGIEVETEALPAGVGVVIRTTEQWFIGPVEVHGKANLPPSLGQMANAARLDLGQPFFENDLDNAVESMRGLLEREGLYQSKITPRIERDPAHQQVSITFDVAAGKRARLTLPTIEGDSKIPAGELAKAAKYKGWFRWKPATGNNTQRGLLNIRSKYSKQDRLTASVTLDDREYLKDENRVRPLITANGGPKVKITAKEARISQSKLKKYVPVFDEETVNRDLLVSGARNLRDYFQFQGYFDVQVDFDITAPNPDLQQITYTIGLGERHRVASVEITGNHYFTTATIRERMFTQAAGFIRLRHGRYSQGFAKQDEDAIAALYHDNGFRDVKTVITSVANYKGKKGDVAVKFSISEGLQYRVAKTNLTGFSLPNRDALMMRLASAPGEPFSETNMAMDRDYILNLYESAGYPDANVDFKMSPGPAPDRVNVDYTVTPGRAQFVRDVVITGLHVTRNRLVNPVLRMKSGQPLSLTEMGRTQRRLYDLGVFDKVDMAIQDPDGNVENKYVLYHLVEGHKYYTALGVGAQVARFGGSQSSLDAPSGATGFSPNIDFEASRLNLWGLGHSLNFKSRYSTLDRRVSLNYLAPRYRNVEGRNISFTALYDNTRDVLTYNATRYEGSLQYSQKLSKPTTFLLRYTWRDAKVDQSTLKISPLLIPLYSQPSRVAEIGTSIIQDRRDDPVNAHRGIYNSLNVDFAEHYLGGNKNFARFLGRNSYYKTFGSFTIASNTEFGVIKTFLLSPGFIPSTYIPLPERFFGGGSTSLRAFPDNQAGPRDPLTGFPIGGNALLFHSTELRFPLIGENINGVIFHDLGNIYTGLSRMSFRFHQNGLNDFDYMAHAAGFGIRYRTPVGPIRVDLAYSLNPPTFNGLKGTYQDLILGRATQAIQSVSHFQFFFSIGQAF